MRHAHTRATALPADLVEARRAPIPPVKGLARSPTRFRFRHGSTDLAEVVNLVREQAAALAPALALPPYDALMDGYQRGVRAADVAPVFAAYEAFLRRVLPQVEARQARQPAPLRPAGSFPIVTQEALCCRLSERIGLDFDHARLDRSAHPFSGGTPTDVRITTRYDEADFTQAVLAVMHETGHALYERGLPGLTRVCRSATQRDGGAREPIADHRDAGVPVRSVPALARPAIACCVRRRRLSLRARESGSTLASCVAWIYSR